MSGRDEVARHYAEVARAAVETGGNAEQTGCCCGDETGSEAALLYADDILAGIPAAVRSASRGCGDPVALADLKPGERVLDLGSGGGIDALIAARLVGPAGFVHGLDMVPEMVELARTGAVEAGIDNVAFIEGDIADIPLPNASVDVAISNCVISLCEDKAAVFKEVRRVLAPGGRMVVSDIVAFAPLPADAYEPLCTVTGCRNGIPDAGFYRAMLLDCGFDDAVLEPKTHYTYEVLKEKARRKHHEDALPTIARCEAGGLTGSVIVRASVDGGGR